MFRLVFSLIVASLLLAGEVSAQCQSGGQQTSQASVQQSQLLQQQLNQLRQLQESIQLSSARSREATRETSVAQSRPAVRTQPVRQTIQARQLTVEQEIAARGYKLRVSPTTGRLQLVTTADNPDKFTGAEIVRISEALQRRTAVASTR